jgi:hypothetical protein
VQLGGDAQREVHVQAVVVRIEGPSIRAAGLRLQDGRLSQPENQAASQQQEQQHNNKNNNNKKHHR